MEDNVVIGHGEGYRMLVPRTTDVALTEAELTRLIVHVKSGTVQYTRDADLLNKLERARAQLNGHTVFITR